MRLSVERTPDAGPLGVVARGLDNAAERSEETRLGRTKPLRRLGETRTAAVGVLPTVVARAVVLGAGDPKIERDGGTVFRSQVRRQADIRTLRGYRKGAPDGWNAADQMQHYRKVVWRQYP